MHVIAEAEVPPEKVVTDLKAYASRALNQLGHDAPGRRRWARQGSTRWVWEDQDIREAIRYVVEEQGESIAIFLRDLP